MITSAEESRSTDTPAIPARKQ